MSFGFSASEIIFLSQSVYKLCIRAKNAGPEFAKLTHTVDGVCRTLEYLVRHASERFSADPDNVEAVRVQQSLEAIIHGCVSTLKDMHRVLGKYTEHLADSSTTRELRPEPRSKVTRATTMVTKFLRRLEWAGKEYEIKHLRDKLGTDMAAIGMMLNITTSITAQETRRTQLSRAESAEVKEEQNDCLKTISFPEFDRRRNDVLEAKEGT